MTKKCSLILSLVLCVLGCAREPVEIEPALPGYDGYFEANQNFKAWKGSALIGFPQDYLTKISVFTFYDGIPGFYAERLNLTFGKFKIGKTALKNDFYLELEEGKVYVGYTKREADVPIGKYELDQSPSNFIEITKLSADKKTVEGRFDLAFRLTDKYGEIDKSYNNPDKVRFTKGSFKFTIP